MINNILARIMKIVCIAETVTSLKPKDISARKIPSDAILLQGTTTANFQIWALNEHIWIKIRGDIIFLTIRRRDNYKVHIRAHKFETYTNGTPS